MSRWYLTYFINIKNIQKLIICVTRRFVIIFTNPATGPYPETYESSSFRSIYLRFTLILSFHPLRGTLVVSSLWVFRQSASACYNFFHAPYIPWNLAIIDWFSFNTEYRLWTHPYVIYSIIPAFPLLHVQILIHRKNSIITDLNRKSWYRNTTLWYRLAESVGLRTQHRPEYEIRAVGVLSGFTRLISGSLIAARSVT